MSRNRNKKRFGIFYKSQGRWNKSHYAGITFTAYQLTRRPLKAFLSETKNYVLKSRVKLLPVG